MSAPTLSSGARFAVLFAAIGGLLFDGVELGLMPVASLSVSQSMLGDAFTPTLGGHFSLEQDYRSFGLQGSLAADLNQKLTTVIVGGSRDQDRVTPLHGIVNGLSLRDTVVADSRDKHVTTALIGVTQVLTRRWLMGVNLSRTWEDGYLTEPYKVLSMLDSTGTQVETVREKRPGTRRRWSVQVNSAYHLTRDVLSLSYRRYEDDWHVRSNTYDVRYRMPQGGDAWFEPHVRVYAQSAASFFRQGLPYKPSSLPDYGSADMRLGVLRTFTLGATYGFKVSGSPGDWYVRAEFMRQSGTSHPADAIGIQRTFNQAPSLNVASLVVGWTFER